MFRRVLLAASIAMVVSGSSLASSPIYFECTPKSSGFGLPGQGVFMGSGMDCAMIPSSLILKLPDPAVVAAQKKMEEERQLQEAKIAEDARLARIAEAKAQQEALAAQVAEKEARAKRAAAEAEEAKAAMEAAVARAREAESALKNLPTPVVNVVTVAPAITPAIAPDMAKLAASVAKIAHVEPKTEPVLPKASGVSYGPVQSGENIRRIAEAVYPNYTGTLNDLVDEFVRLNPRAFVKGDSDRIRVGMSLKIPLVVGMTPAKVKRDPLPSAVKPDPAMASVKAPVAAVVSATPVPAPTANEVVKAHPLTPSRESLVPLGAKNAQSIPPAPATAAPVVFEPVKTANTDSKSEAKKKLLSEIEEIRRQMNELNTKVN